MFIEFSFVQIWSFCWRKTAFAEVLMGAVKYINNTKDKFFTLYKYRTMSPGPSQCPAHTGTAGLTAHWYILTTEGSTTQRGQTKTRDYRY